MNGMGTKGAKERRNERQWLKYIAFLALKSWVLCSHGAGRGKHDLWNYQTATIVFLGLRYRSL